MWCFPNLIRRMCAMLGCWYEMFISIWPPFSSIYMMVWGVEISSELRLYIYYVYVPWAIDFLLVAKVNFLLHLRSKTEDWLTSDALCHDISHFAARGQHPHAELVHNQSLQNRAEIMRESQKRTLLQQKGLLHMLMRAVWKRIY